MLQGLITKLLPLGSQTDPVTLESKYGPVKLQQKTQDGDDNNAKREA